MGTGTARPPASEQFTRSDLHIERNFHKDAPYQEVNKSVYTMMNVFNIIWDKRRLGLAKFRGLKITFNWAMFRPRKINPQNLNPTMQAALTKELSVFIDAVLCGWLVHSFLSLSDSSD